MALSFITIITIITLCIVSGADTVENDGAGNNDKYDILIVGAGITALSHTHLLSTLTDNNYKTLTVERFNRICGRTHSSTLKHDGKSITFEHGAMRFYYNEYHQKMLHRMGLCDNIVPFEHYFFCQIRNNSNFLYRNKLKPASEDLFDFFRSIYNINDEESVWMNDTDLPQSMGYTQILQENKDKMRINFWESWTLNDILVKDWDLYSFWKVVLNPSMEYFNYENKNGRIVSDVNVAEMFLKWIADNPTILDMYPSPVGPDDQFPGFQDDKYARMTEEDLHNEGGIFWSQYIRNENESNGTHYTLDIGYDAICQRLYDNSSSYEFNHYLFEYDVIAVEKRNNGNYPYMVILQNVHNNNEIKRVYANKIISTVAPEHLSLLLKNTNFGPNTADYNQFIQNDLLNSVILDESYKVSLIYDDVWWQENKLTDKAGHLLTDINIQTFLMEEAWTNDTLTVVHFYMWGPQQSHLFHRLQQLGPIYEPDDNIWVNNNNTLLLSSQMLVDEVINQLEELTQINNIPLPLAAYSSPLGFNFSHNSGVYRWKYGYNIHDILDNIIKPIDTEEFYVTTSSISPYQGWMYGGIWATLQNLEQNFGVIDPLKNEETCLPDPDAIVF